MVSTPKSVNARILSINLSGPVSVGQPGQFIMPAKVSFSSSGYSANVPFLFRKSARQLTDEQPRSWVALVHVKIPIFAICRSLQLPRRFSSTIAHPSNSLKKKSHKNKGLDLRQIVIYGITAQTQQGVKHKEVIFFRGG